MCFKISDPIDAVKHLLGWSLQELEFVVKEMSPEGESIFPTIQHILSDECWGDKLIDLLALIHPLIEFAEKQFPEYANLIEWCNTIASDIARFAPLHNSKCTCGANK